MIANRYQPQEEIGRGTFCVCYKGKDSQQKRYVAIKQQYNQQSLPNGLAFESNILKQVQAQGIPKLYWCGNHEGQYTQVTELLGMKFSDLIKQQFPFSVEKTVQVGMILLQILQNLHEKGYIHRDIKPGNIMIGRKITQSQIYLIDFGLSRKFLNPITKQHAPYQEHCGIKGNAIFSSQNCLNGISPGRRDDLESLAYLLIYLTKGCLPWSRFGQENQNAILQLRSKTNYQMLGKEYPILNEFLQYSIKLQYQEKPDYQHWIQRFQAAFDKNRTCYCRISTYKCIIGTCRRISLNLVVNTNVTSHTISEQASPFMLDSSPPSPNKYIDEEPKAMSPIKQGRRGSQRRKKSPKVVARKRFYSVDESYQQEPNSSNFSSRVNQLINLNLVSTQSRNEGDSPGKITLVKFEDDSDSGNFDVSDEKIPESVKRWREANSGVVTKANTTEINDSQVYVLETEVKFQKGFNQKTLMHIQEIRKRFQSLDNDPIPSLSLINN